jgi:exportin-1
MVNMLLALESDAWLRCLQAKTKELKLTLNNEFRSIHELCMFVLLNTRKTELLRATLTALAAYLSWVPPGYIFESQLVTALLGLFPQAPFRNVALQCLTEVRAQPGGIDRGRGGQGAVVAACRTG